MMEYPWAVPGQKVLCIDSFQGTGRMRVLKARAVYTISRVISHDPRMGDGPYGQSTILLLLKEVRNPYTQLFAGGFAIERFRPLITKTQEEDVSVFRHLLAGVEA